MSLLIQRNGSTQDGVGHVGIFLRSALPPVRFSHQELEYKPEEITIRLQTHVNMSASTTPEGTTAKYLWPGYVPLFLKWD